MADEKNPQMPEETRKETESHAFESDTQKLVHKHLENKDHVITEEEIKNVRVGMSPPPDHQMPEGDEKAADHKTTYEDETVPGAQKITPWDLIGPG